MKETQKYHVVFFGGGETGDEKFNVFTGSFIRFLSRIMEEQFTFIKGIYFRYPVTNVFWALNNAQKPIKNPGKNFITSSALKQLIPEGKNHDTQLIILSSSSGSIVAAQTACYLADEGKNHQYYTRPFHLVLGTNFLSKESDLFLRLLDYQESGLIGRIIFDELQDEGDSIYETGGRSMTEAWVNALGLMVPWLSTRFKGPSFLNTDPKRGHLHRRRSQTVQKAVDFIEVIFIKNKLAGDLHCEKAISVLADQR